jgi:hypothetical protein
VGGGRAGGGRGKYDDVLLIVALCFEFPLPRNGLEWHSERCLYFCSTERKPELFLFRGMVRNGIPRGYFFSIFDPQDGIPSFFSTAAGFGTEFSEVTSIF